MIIRYGMLFVWVSVVVGMLGAGFGWNLGSGDGVWMGCRER